MILVEGNILKMEGRVVEGLVHYRLPIGKERIEMNPLVGKNIKLRFCGVINDIVTGEVIKKSYNYGYSYKNFISLAQCDLCIVKPELCHFDKGTCRQPQWGEKHCLVDHIVYLSVTNHLKVGITRMVGREGRWIDQGAEWALPLVKVKDRLTSGLIEKELSKEYRDKTNWRKMLEKKRDDSPPDLMGQREHIFECYSDLFDDMDAEDFEGKIIQLDYPVEKVPPLLKPLSLERESCVEGKLYGIKGQYLLFEQGVVNVRKHQGYRLEMQY